MTLAHQQAAHLDTIPLILIGVAAAALAGVAVSRWRRSIALLASAGVLAGVLAGTIVGGLRHPHGEGQAPPEPLATTVGCVPTGAATGSRWALSEAPDGFHLFSASDSVGAEVVVPWCEEVTVRTGTLTATIQAGGPLLTTPGRLLGAEARPSRLGGRDVAVAEATGDMTESVVAWTNDAIFFVARGRGSAGEVVRLVDQVSVEAGRLVVRQPATELGRRAPVEWLIAGAARSTAVYGSGGAILQPSQGEVQTAFDRAVTVETIRRSIDADTLFPNAASSSSVTVSGRPARLFTASDRRVLVLVTDGAVVQLRSTRLSEAGLVAAASTLVPVDDAGWAGLTATAGMNPAAGGVQVQVSGDGDGSPGTAVVLAGGILAAAALAITANRFRRRPLARQPAA